MPHRSNGNNPDPEQREGHLYCPFCGAMLRSAVTARALMSMMRAIIIALGMIVAAIVATQGKWK